MKIRTVALYSFIFARGFTVFTVVRSFVEKRAKGACIWQFAATLPLLSFTPFSVQGTTSKSESTMVPTCEDSVRREENVVNAFVRLSEVGLKLKVIKVEDLRWAEEQTHPVVPARSERNLDSSSVQVGFKLLARQITEEQWKMIVPKLKKLRKRWGEDSAQIDESIVKTEPIYLWRSLDYRANGLSDSQMATAHGEVFFTTHLFPDSILEIHDQSHDAKNNFEMFKNHSSDFFVTKTGDVLLATLIDQKTLIVVDARTRKEKMRYDLSQTNLYRPLATPPLFYKPLLFESPGTEYAAKDRLMVALVAQGPRIFVENSKEFPMAMVDVASGNYHEFKFPTGTFQFERLKNGHVYAFGFGNMELHGGTWGTQIRIVNLSTHYEIVNNFYPSQTDPALLLTLAVDNDNVPHLYARDKFGVLKYDEHTNKFTPIEGFENARLPLFVRDKSNRRLLLSFGTSKTGGAYILTQPVGRSEKAMIRELPGLASDAMSVGIADTPNGSQVFLGKNMNTNMSGTIHVYDVEAQSFFSLGTIPVSVHRIKGIFYSAKDNRIYALFYDKNGRLFTTHLAQVWGPVKQAE